jgi:HAD superfamily hydrolase (TIGR01509 family)
MYRAIFFDLDDTLFDRAAALRRWVARHVGNLDSADLAWVIDLDDRGRRPRLHFAAAIVERFRIQRTVTELAAAFPAELAVQVEPEVGARETIVRLAADRRVAVVTNGGPAQRDKLARAGLADVLETVFVSGELGMAKPAPAIFERALAWSALEPAECLFVGDDPIHDIAPAAALGMATAWRVPSVGGVWPAELASPRFAIRSIAELEAHA